MTDVQSGWPTEASPQPNTPVAGGCEEAVYGVQPYQPCNRRAEVVVGFPGYDGQWRYCRQCANNRTGLTIICDYEGNDFVEPDFVVGGQVIEQPPAGWGQAVAEGGAALAQAEVLPTESPAIEDGVPMPEDGPSWGQPAEAAHVAVPETPEAFKRRLTDEVQTWRDSKETLTEAKDAEMNARLTLTSTCFPTPKKGTQRYELDGGYKVKLQFGWNYSLGIKGKLSEQGTEVSIYDQVAALERDISNLGPEGSLLVERLIKWKPELSGTEYEALARDSASEVEVQAKALIDELLTVTPKSPTLELEEPKPVK